MSPALLRSQRIGPHLKVTLDDASRQSALSTEMVAELDRALAQSRAENLSSLVIAGANGVFSAGADLKSVSEALAYAPRDGEADPLQDTNRAGGQFFARLNAHPVVTIALVDGPAFGGGMGLACCTDIVIATSRARFALSRDQSWPAAGADRALCRGADRPAPCAASCAHRRAAGRREAAAIGLADFYCETDAERDARLAAAPKADRRCAPGANAETKRLPRLPRRAAGVYIETARRVSPRPCAGPRGGKARGLRGKRAPSGRGRQ